MQMLIVKSKDGLVILRTTYLSKLEFKKQAGYYQSIGFITEGF